MRREDETFLAFARALCLIVLVLQDVRGHPTTHKLPDPASLESQEKSVQPSPPHPARPCNSSSDEQDFFNNSHETFDSSAYHSYENSEEEFPHRSPRSPCTDFREEQNSTDSSKDDQPKDEVTKLVERAYRNGELIDPEEWSEGNRDVLSRGVQRDTSRYQDTHTSSTSLKTRRSKGQQERRRVFDQEDTTTTERMQSDGKIVFPTDDDTLNRPHKFDSAPVCQGSTFCERASFYPEDLVNQAIHMNDSLKYLAGVDVVSDIVQRIDVPDDVPLCVSTEQVVYPKSAENKRKEWLFVVNQDNFKQGVRIETCSNENGDCSVIDGLAEGYRTTCRQKYIYRQLAAVSADGSVAPEMFRFPSSCCCHVKFTGNPLTRMGVNLGEKKSQTTVSRRRRRT